MYVALFVPILFVTVQKDLFSNIKANIFDEVNTHFPKLCNLHATKKSLIMKGLSPQCSCTDFHDV